MCIVVNDDAPALALPHIKTHAWGKGYGPLV